MQSPTRESGRVRWATLTEDECIERIGKLGGTPPEILANRDLMRISIKSMRADSQLLDDYA